MINPNYAEKDLFVTSGKNDSIFCVGIMVLAAWNLTPSTTSKASQQPRIQMQFHNPHEQQLRSRGAKATSFRNIMSERVFIVWVIVDYESLSILFKKYNYRKLFLLLKRKLLHIHFFFFFSPFWEDISPVTLSPKWVTVWI